MLQISTNSNRSWEVDYQPNGPISVAGEQFTWDLVMLGDGRYHLLYQGRSYSIEVISTDYTAKIFTLKVDNHLIELQAKDRFDLLLDRLGMAGSSAHRVNELKAPMPGLIVDIRVKPDQTVQKGDPLLVLEAMKMENILKAPVDGVVSSIKVSLRDNVGKGQVLISFS
ncbi:acetyl-CoA carboxylase biotin carboxyl carrier protein subunit [Hymenobacter crusticola]|uniref:Acetyl-CoA carboxylase biotin carboxyl carrier protein subunit n=1 Tax=Hymenobacter crusticola TaxID=1770526 RepID=A0A243WHA0_9BACT|nr:acetyl-CoA carboxylase biotin carboxyl carrier protein subunit [Hymenobacter crusticola]OUJ75175.1 acetyl-CoA carboxylase biotin carboxyl carrier protein subunit [Hymenobacter crusticola]